MSLTTPTSTSRTARSAATSAATAEADWSDPGLVAGRSRVATPVMIALILVGSAVDTFAFKTTLDVFLRESEWISWGMAVAITVVAQLAAWTDGTLAAHWRHRDPSVPGLAVAAITTLWCALGVTLWYVRWHSVSPAASAGSTTFGGTALTQDAVGKAHAGAFLFLALFLVSGVVTAVEAYLHTNPWFASFERLGRRLRTLRALVVLCESRAERARLAAAHHAGEVDRDLDRRKAAIAERRALGAEMANLARVYIAQLKQDPSVTDVCSSGPLPEDGGGAAPRGGQDVSASGSSTAVPA